MLKQEWQSRRITVGLLAIVLLGMAVGFQASQIGTSWLALSFVPIRLLS